MTVRPGQRTGAHSNISWSLRERAQATPEAIAVRVMATGEELSFRALEQRCDSVARGLRDQGLREGDRVVLFVLPGPDLLVVTHALYRIGAVPVLIDPGMGRDSLLACIERTRPRGLIGIPRAHLARRLFPRAFRSVEVLVTVGRRWLWGGTTLARLEALGAAAKGAFPITTGRGDQTAAVLFTSGSTGPPKGVVYTHAMFAGQLASLQRIYGLRPGEVDVACFPLFALFDNALGMTSVFPDMDPSKPGSCDPEKIHAAIEDSGATFTFGSPAIWRRVHDWARTSGARFSRLERITIAGAPVPPWLIAGLRTLLPPGGDVHTPYGATEALPVANLAGSELEGDLRERVESGEGTCVGRPVPGIEVRLIRITDEPLARWSDDLLSPAGEPGEICVRGRVVTREYLFEEEETARAKIHEGDTVWHRMGDVGYFDDEGRLWFLGRKSHRLETDHGLLMPVPLENAFNVTPRVHRTALVGVGARGHERPHLVVELSEGATQDEVTAALQARRAQLADGARIEGFLFHAAFPVDVRHNAKIHRGELKRWAEERLS